MRCRAGVAGGHERAEKLEPLLVFQTTFAERREQCARCRLQGVIRAPLRPRGEPDRGQQAKGHPHEARGGVERAVHAARAVELGHRLRQRLRVVPQRDLGDVVREARELQAVAADPRRRAKRARELESARRPVLGLLRHRPRQHGVELARELPRQRGDGRKEVLLGELLAACR